MKQKRRNHKNLMTKFHNVFTVDTLPPKIPKKYVEETMEYKYAHECSRFILRYNGSHPDGQEII